MAAAAVPVCLALEPDASQARIEQSRQFGSTFRPPEAQVDGGSAPINPVVVDLNDESFGSQQILKRAERNRAFNAFGDVSGFYTDNVALTRTHALGDAFLVANAGLTYQNKLADNLDCEVTVKGGTFRYSKFTELDFNSLDAGGGASYRMPRLWDVSLFARYNFTDLLRGDTNDEFFQNQTITFGLQKAFILGRAHSLVVGASGEIGFSDPRSSQRDEWSLHAGYHADLTRHLGADLFYSYGYQVYAEGGRRDNNHTLTLALRYSFNDWLSIGAATYLSLNDSNQRVFDYKAFSSGGGLNANIRF